MSLWFPKYLRFWITTILIIFLIIWGLLDKIIAPIALIPLLLLATALYLSQLNQIKQSAKILLNFLVLLLSIGLVSHVFPGFNNFKILNHIYLNRDAIPFTMYLSIDKACVGIFILGMSHRLISNKIAWLTLFRQMTVPFFILVFILLALSSFFKFVHLDPKLPNSLLVWIPHNLFVVCVAEEALFRGFLQKKLSLLFNLRFNSSIVVSYLSIMCAAILFGLMHVAGGIRYILLAAVAGIGYGYLYVRTKRIEAAIIGHFGLNLMHFLLFTYPMLASAIS
jgi:uncharacterized protein